MKTFFEWMEESVFPSKPKSIPNPDGKPIMIRVERWSNYVQKPEDLDGGDIFFFDAWEEALEWMKKDYYEYSGSWDFNKEDRLAFNLEHGVRYKAFEELGSAEAHNEFGY
jgi:hypothetical protein